MVVEWARPVEVGLGVPSLTPPSSASLPPPAPELFGLLEPALGGGVLQGGSQTKLPENQTGGGGAPPPTPSLHHPLHLQLCCLPIDHSVKQKGMM